MKIFAERKNLLFEINNSWTQNAKIKTDGRRLK